MSDNVRFDWSELPESYCLTSFQQFQRDLFASLTGTVDSTAAGGFSFGPDEPSVEDRDKPWLQTGTDFSPVGWKIFWNGAWTNAQQHPIAPGVIVNYYGSTADIPTLDGGSSANPYWRVCDGTNGTPDLRSRFIVGAGQGTGLTDRPFGTTGGAESHVLTVEQIPPHQHTVSARDPIEITTGAVNAKICGEAGSSGVPFDGVVNSSSTGGSGTSPSAAESHPNVPPFFALYFIMRTSRLF